jgi:citrate lyase subunit beta/citryl-CoA lyase/(S)-citramalyl-CoA lyase
MSFALLVDVSDRLEHRSLLSTPATVVRYHSGSLRSGASGCVLDLEDSVPEQQKDRARVLAEDFFAQPAGGPAWRGLRINAITTPAGLRDLLAVGGYRVAPELVVLPKVDSPRDVQIADQVLADDCPRMMFLAVVETPRGLEHAYSIAAASPRMRGLIFGAADYAAEVGVRLHWDALVHARARLVNSARAARVAAIDSPTFQVADLDLLAREAELARDLGFSGKFALHPRQVAVINDVFTPSQQAIEEARRIVATGRANGFGIGVVADAMVGPPFYQAAQRLVDEYELFDAGARRATSLP